MISHAGQFDAIILAGGTSSRMGSPKALLDWNGLPLWKHIVRTVSPIVGRVRIVGFPVEPSPGDLNEAEFIEDPLGIGPLGGLVAGLRGVESPKAFVMACDMPFVTQEAILELWERSQGYDVVLPRTADGFHPLFAFYSRDCLGAIEKAIQGGELRLRSFFSDLRVSELRVPDGDPRWRNVLFNINTPEDLAKALAKKNFFFP